MNISYSFFADAVSLDSNGKVNALGIFDNLYSTQFPAVHPRMFYVINIKAHRSEIGDHFIKLVFVDQDGKVIFGPIENTLTINEVVRSSTMVIELNNTTFQTTGTHAVDAIVDGHHIGSTNLSVLAVNN